MNTLKDEIREYDIDCTLRNLNMAAEFYAGNEIGVLAKDAHDTIVSLHDELEHRLKITSSLTKVNRMLKNEYKRLGGTGEVIARIWAFASNRNTVA